MSVPKGYENDLSSYGPVLRDSSCREFVAWGYSIVRHLGEERFRALGKYGDLECIRPGEWCLVTKWITPAEAIEKYGAVTALELGPQGGFRSVTYGAKKFLTRALDPRRVEEQPK